MLVLVVGRRATLSALQSIGIVHFRKDFLPRMPRMPRMENLLLLIRGIREIRGCISLVAGLPRCVLCAKKMLANIHHGCGWQCEAKELSIGPGGVEFGLDERRGVADNGRA
jgi:hypothetical protein